MLSVKYKKKHPYLKMQMKALEKKQTTQEETIQAAKALVDQLLQGKKKNCDSKGMAVESKFYWFGLSVSTLGSTLNRTN